MSDIERLISATTWGIEQSMNSFAFTFGNARLHARPTGTLHWPEQGLLCVSDLHFGRSERIARLGGTLLPPYDTRETLCRLENEVRETAARTVVCLGDSFDDLGAGTALPEQERLWLQRLMAGRDWIWIEGNHDPGPVDVGGRHLGAMTLAGIVFRHVASMEMFEISGHYHPKATVSLGGRQVTRRCFLIDGTRTILPAFGTYTGGLACDDPVLAELMAPDALAVLTGTRACPMPMYRRKTAKRSA